MTTKFFAVPYLCDFPASYTNMTMYQFYYDRLIIIIRNDVSFKYGPSIHWVDNVNEFNGLNERITQGTHNE